MKEEIWKQVVGYEGLYEVSSLGRVRSLNYGRTGNVMLLKQRKDKYGYLTVGLYKIGKKKLLKVHRLVCEAFLSNLDKLPVVNHKNCIRYDNRVENLEWCTVKYNAHYSRGWEKSSEVTSKPVLQYTKSGQFVAEYQSLKEAERKTGIRSSHISGCCLGKKWYKSAGNYIWKFK